MTSALVPAVSSSLPPSVPFFCNCTLSALSSGWRSRLSNVRELAPLANAGVWFANAANDVAAKPDGTHARGEGEGDGSALGFGAGLTVCARAGTVPNAHAAVKAAARYFKPPPYGV